MAWTEPGSISRLKLSRIQRPFCSVEAAGGEPASVRDNNETTPIMERRRFGFGLS